MSVPQEVMLQRTLPAHAPAVTVFLATAVLCALVCVAGIRTLEQTDLAAYPGTSPAELATQAQAIKPLLSLRLSCMLRPQRLHTAAGLHCSGVLLNTDH